MTIEKQIDKEIIKEYENDYYLTTSIDWFWFGEPDSIRFDRSDRLGLWQKIDKIIKEASIEECLTSKSEYVRECKKWMIKNIYNKYILVRLGGSSMPML